MQQTKSVHANSPQASGPSQTPVLGGDASSPILPGMVSQHRGARHLLTGSIYRVWQFWRGLRARIRVEEWADVERLLSPRAVALFRRMPRDAQRHSLDVTYRLVATGYTDEDLLVASLLHDVGKVAADAGPVSLNLWLRGPLVLATFLAPQWLEQVASADPAAGWRYVVYVQRCHAEIGARWARAAGCSELTCWLIARHQDKQDDRLALPMACTESKRIELLHALQWADEQF